MSKILVRETDSKNKFERLTILWSGVLISLSLIVVIYGIFHTFDWSDEAWALSLIANNRESVGEPYAFQHLVHPIYVFLGENIIAVRLLRFTAFLALGVFSAFMLMRIAETKGLSFSKNQKTVVYIVSQLGTILVWSWPPRYFSYNELSSILVQVIALLLAYSFFRQRQTAL